MTQLLRDLLTYLRADFKPGLYIATALWAGLLMGVNYSLNLEDGFIDAQPFSVWRPVWYFGLYATAYYGAFGIWIVAHRRNDLWRSRPFWVHTLVGLLVYSGSIGFGAYAALARQIADFRLYVYAYKLMGNLHSIFTILLPLVLYYWFFEPNRGGFYGLQPKRKGLLLYVVLLALMVPIITYASFQPDFLLAYPTYRDTGAHLALNVPEWLTILVFELAYGWDFVPTELLFRGFLVVGLNRALQVDTEQNGLWFGPVLPMVVWYATIHFGRPPGEAISSLFGGYVLGVLALSTRSIWGGLLIHVGIAWLMELAAALQQS